MYQFRGMKGHLAAVAPDAPVGVRSSAEALLSGFAVHMGNAANHVKGGGAASIDAARSSLTYAESTATTLRIAADAAEDALKDIRDELDTPEARDARIARNKADEDRVRSERQAAIDRKNAQDEKERAELAARELAAGTGGPEQVGTPGRVIPKDGNPSDVQKNKPNDGTHDGRLEAEALDGKVDPASSTAPKPAPGPLSAAAPVGKLPPAEPASHPKAGHKP